MWLGCLALASLCTQATERADEPQGPVGLDVVEANFELLNSHGETVMAADFRGRHLLIAFGFTHCPHICPMTAAKMVAALQQADTDADANALGIFISVDTERDTPAIVGAYAAKFGTKLLGLSGSHQQVAAAASNFKVSYAVTKTQDNYTVQHTSHLFLLDPHGDLVEVFALTTPTATIAAAIR